MDTKECYKEGTTARKILEIWTVEELSALTSSVVAGRVECSKSAAKWALRKIKDDFGIERKHLAPGSQTKRTVRIREQSDILCDCAKCIWWKSLSGNDSNPNACLFCFLNDHSRRRENGICLEYTTREMQRRKLDGKIKKQDKKERKCAVLVYDCPKI